MIKEVLWYMRNDSELANLVGYTLKNRRINPYTPFNKEDYPYIVLEISPLIAGNIITQYRCDIIVYTKDVLLLESISNRLLYLFHHKKNGMVLDGKTIYKSTHAGGSGIIYYSIDKVFEQTLTFNIKSN